MARISIGQQKILDHSPSRLVTRFAVVAILTAFVAAGCLTGCSSKQGFVLEADKSQPGGGARIVLDGKEGRIKMAPAPFWPQGLDRTVTLNPTSANPLNQFWTVTMEPKTELTFVKTPSGWVCQDCIYYHLPVAWHPVAL